MSLPSRNNLQHYLTRRCLMFEHIKELASYLNNSCQHVYKTKSLSENKPLLRKECRLPQIETGQITSISIGINNNHIYWQPFSFFAVRHEHRILKPNHLQVSSLQTLHMSVFITASILNFKMLHFGGKICCLGRDMSNTAGVRWIYTQWWTCRHAVMDSYHMYRCNNEQLVRYVWEGIRHWSQQVLVTTVTTSVKVLLKNTLTSTRTGNAVWIISTTGTMEHLCSLGTSLSFLFFSMLALVRNIPKLQQKPSSRILGQEFIHMENRRFQRIQS